MFAPGSTTESGRGLRRLWAGHSTLRCRAVPHLLGRSPHRIAVRAANITATLDDPPEWLGDFGAYLVGRHHPSRACAMLTRLGKQLADEHPVHPQALLEAVAADCRWRGRWKTSSPRTSWRCRRIVTNDARGRAAAVRIDAVPEPLRPAVAGFAEYLVAGRDRARRAGTHPRGHATLEARLTAMRDFAQFLTARRGKTDWATIDVGDVEAFLHAHPGRRAFYLTGLRQFCRHALRRRLMLIDPTAAVQAPQTMAFRGPTLPVDRQRELFGGGAPTPTCTPTKRSSGWPPCCTAPPPKNCSTSPTKRSTTSHAASGWVADHSA